METAISIATMYHRTAIELVPGVKSIRLITISPASSMLVQSRHDIVLKALKANCTHVLFVDSDMQFPKDMLQRLLKHNKDFVAVNATNRAFPVKHIAHDLKGHEIDSRKKHGLQKVQHVGLGIALIRTDVFKAMDPPLFMMEWIPDLAAYCGEDVYFCAKVQAAGFDLYIDHDLSHEVCHVGKLTYGPGMIGREELQPEV